MNEEQKEIIEIITEIWIDSPQLRFGQLLFCLEVIDFANKEQPQLENYNLRDIFADPDKSLLKRIKMSDFYKEYIKPKDLDL